MRGLAFAPYADLLWCETGTPDLGQAAEFAEAIHAEFPDKMLAYNCSPSFNWKRHLDDDDDRALPARARRDGVRVPVHHAGRLPRAEPLDVRAGRGYAAEGMPAYVRLQESEFAAEAAGYTATRHQREVGTGWFDLVSTVIDPESSTTALAGSTEAAQFATAGH